MNKQKHINKQDEVEESDEVIGKVAEEGFTVDNSDSDDSKETNELNDSTNGSNQKNEEDPCLPYKNQYIRALADYRNLENRLFQEKQKEYTRGQVSMATELLPFIDNIDNAEIFIKDKGLSMVRDQFIQTLGKIGFAELQVLGAEYDPYTAEALEMVSGEVDNIVVEVIQRGFSFNGTIVRPAKVKVSKKQ